MNTNLRPQAAIGGDPVASPNSLRAAAPKTPQSLRFDRVAVPVRMPVDLVAKLDQIAAQRGEARSTTIRLLLRDAVERCAARSAERQG